MVSALCGPESREGPLNDRLRREGVACFEAAGIDFATAAQDRDRRAGRLTLGSIGAQSRLGDSSWQSLARGTGAIETDYLNGEIVLLGRLHGVPTPANELVCALARRAAQEAWPPGSMIPQDLLGMLEADDRGGG